jgi:hypothetical protein
LLLSAKAVLLPGNDQANSYSVKEAGMPISKSRKEELVATYVELLKNSVGIVITQNDGMKMANFDALRVKMRELGSTYMVTKNTLLELALKEVGMPVPQELAPRGRLPWRLPPRTSARRPRPCSTSARMPRRSSW